ncbi:hypothetical protein [uncultured Desulfobulbus sp.]|uniref:hypothetical protein n=1 Tax=uncultured Desulfobulbus sp. TaxID=239745 RepID=UPI0029C7F3D1|nr:hypothetical protein [uncultured Desulfobulbus sp.]
MTRQKHFCSFAEPNHIEFGQCAQTVSTDLFNDSKTKLVISCPVSVLFSMRFPFDGVTVYLDVLAKSHLPVNQRGFACGLVTRKIHFLARVPDRSSVDQLKNDYAAIINGVLDSGKHVSLVAHA